MYERINVEVYENSRTLVDRLYGRINKELCVAEKKPNYDSVKLVETKSINGVKTI